MNHDGFAKDLELKGSRPSSGAYKEFVRVIGLSEW